MSSLFPDDTRPGLRRAPVSPSGRRFPARPKAVEGVLPSPEPGWLLAHCDGGARGNPGPAGFGAVLVDGAGAPLGELSEFLGFRTNNYAEYSGLLAVLAWALEHGQQRVRVVSDSELMVKQIQGRYKVNSPDLRPLFEEARRRIGQLTSFEIHHALRHKNKDADRLANEAIDRGMGRQPAATTATPYPAARPAPAAPARIDTPTGRADAGSARKDAAPVHVVARPAAAAAPAVSSQVASQDPSRGISLRGFVRDGVVHILGSGKLPEGSFVKILPE